MAVRHRVDPRPAAGGAALLSSRQPVDAKTLHGLPGSNDQSGRPGTPIPIVTRPAGLVPFSLLMMTKRVLPLPAGIPPHWPELPETARGGAALAAVDADVGSVDA
jgi:hypothetical protein